MTGDDDMPEDRTIFIPATPAAPPPAAVPGSTPPATSFAPMAPRVDGNRIQVGDVLNHIFEVKRFIARGGMGEVFEGANVNSDERVAIKVMLPALAADPNVVAMFRKEARTLTRLSHPALVQYRVLAQEPQLGVLYIVTEFVDGRNLSDVLDQVPRAAGDLLALTRRLAQGLAVAHALGAVHRDISPDNVLLEDGRLDHAKIIDFGIAKDLDPGSKTIVGDGFAGKLNYVAPEQLGDFNREVGPWSDVYSLALVILAVAMGRNVDMGATLVDAVDKRRAGPDLSMVPDPVRPVLAAMLRANPAERLRSMAAVIAFLDDGGPAPAPPAPAVAVRAVKADGTAASATARSRLPLLAGGGTIAAIAVAAALWSLGGKPAAPRVTAGSAPTGTTTAAASSVAPVDAIRPLLARTLPGINCSWLDLHEAHADGNGVALTFNGVAGSTAAAQGAISSAAQRVAVPITGIDFQGVAPIQQTACPVLDAFRRLKREGAPLLTTDQVKFEMSMQADGPEAGHAAAVPVIHLAAGAVQSDMTLLGIESNGALTQLLKDRRDLDSNPGWKQPDGNYAIRGAVTTAGWSGNILITGKGPFDPALVAALPAARGTDWQARLEQAAAANGWHADMVWFQVVNEKPD